MKVEDMMSTVTSHLHVLLGQSSCFLFIALIDYLVPCNAKHGSNGFGYIHKLSMLQSMDCGLLPMRLMIPTHILQIQVKQTMAMFYYVFIAAEPLLFMF